MGATFASTVISITVSLIPSVVASTGLGVLCVLAPAGSSAISGGYTSYASADDVAVALAANELTAQGAEDLTAALSQSNSPSSVYVATYDDATETPDDAADTILSAGVDVGVFSLVARVSADLAAMGAWLASGERKWRYKVVAQSADSSLITATPTSDLDACQVDNFHLIYSADTEPAAAGFAGRLAGFNMARDGQTGARMSIASASASTLTSAEVAYAVANNVNALLPADANSTTNIFVGIVDYSGSKHAITSTLLYTVRRIDEAITALTVRFAALAKAIPLSEAGEALVAGQLSGVLGQLASVGHFTAGTSGAGADAIDMPDGFNVSMSRSGGNIIAAVNLIIAGEPLALVFNVIAEEAS